MLFKMKNRYKYAVIASFLFLNILFWIFTTIHLMINVVPFVDRRADFEEEMPAFKFGAWAVPVEMEYYSFSFRTIYTVYSPSYWTMVGLANGVLTNKTWEDRFGPISIGGYVLIGTMIISFIQWYIFAVLFCRLIGLFEKIILTKSA